MRRGTVVGWCVRRTPEPVPGPELLGLDFFPLLGVQGHIPQRVDEGRVLCYDRVRRRHAHVIINKGPGRGVLWFRYFGSVAPLLGDGLRRLHAVPRQQIVEQQLVVLAGLEAHLLEQARKELPRSVRRARGVHPYIRGGGIVLVRRHVQI